MPVSGKRWVNFFPGIRSGRKNSDTSGYVYRGIEIIEAPDVEILYSFSTQRLMRKTPCTTPVISNNNEIEKKHIKNFIRRNWK